MSQLEDLLQQCTVKVALRSSWGTGFFVSPGLILTCAHVVKSAGDQPIPVWWQQTELQATVEQSIEPYDLALLRVALPADANPACVYLDEDIRSRDPLYLFGYPDEGDRQGEPRTFNCDGVTGSGAILFNLGQVRPGMSGSALLNQRTGKVCGMVKFTRDRSIDLGGGAIPTRVVLEQLPQLRDLQPAFHQHDRRWLHCLERTIALAPAPLTSDQPLSSSDLEANPMPPANAIFISYRRSDSHDVTGRIYDRLSEHFGRDVVFKDVHSIPFGVDFRTHLNQGVGNCLVLVAVIGPSWLSVQDGDGKRRLDNPDDWVRAEIETALTREIPVIPLLVSGARLPKVAELPEPLKPLAYHNAAQARPDPDFHRDLDRLIRRLEEIVGSPVSSGNLNQVANAQSMEVQESVKPKQLSSSRKGFYERQITQIEEELATVEVDLASAPRELDRLRLEKVAENLLKKLDELKSKLV